MPRGRAKIANQGLSQRAVDLFRLGRRMQDGGCEDNAQELMDVRLALHRELGLKPWHPFVTTASDDQPDPDMDPMKLGQFELIRELRRKLEEAA
jgi:hypothetical protein